MLPVVAGRDETRRQILLYSLVLVPLTLIPWLLELSGVIYGVGAALLGAEFLRRAWIVSRSGTDAQAMGLFGYSIAYLFLIFVLLLVDRWATVMGV